MSCDENVEKTEPASPSAHLSDPDFWLYVSSHRGADCLQLQRKQEPRGVYRLLPQMVCQPVPQRDDSLRPGAVAGSGAGFLGGCHRAGDPCHHRHQLHEPQDAAGHQQHQLCPGGQSRNHHRRLAHAALCHDPENGHWRGGGRFWLAHAADRPHHLQCSLCNFQCQPQAAPAGLQPLQRGAGSGLHPTAGLFQGDSSPAQPGHPLGVPHLPDLLH